MIGLVLAILFIAMNGFFVAAEFALVKLRATHGLTAADPRDEGARAHMSTIPPGVNRRRHRLVQDAVAKLDRYLGVTQLGITFCSLGLGWIGEPAIAHLGERAALRVTGQPLGSTGEAILLALSFAVLTLAHVLFGELVPKLIAIQRSDAAARAVVPVLWTVNWVFFPALWLLQIASRAVLRFVGLPFDAYGEAALSEDEILGILAANLVRAPHGAHKHDLFRRVMRFADRTARSAMIPRVDVAALPIDTSPPEALEYIRQQQYSRILLHRGTSVDEPVGYLYVKDLLLSGDPATLKSLETVRRDALFVPETQGLLDVLRRMQRAHTPFAVVVDEYGGTSGIVTMEDLLEEIVGEIRDETDVEQTRIERTGDDVWDVDGAVTVEELAAFGIDPGEEDRSLSLGAVVVDQLKRLPRLGDRVAFGDISAEVLTISRRRVTRVRLRRLPRAMPEHAEDPTS